MTAETVGTPPTPNLPPGERCTHPVVQVEALHGFERDADCLLVSANGAQAWDGHAVQVELGRCTSCGSVFARTAVHRPGSSDEVQSTAWAWLAWA